MLAENTQIHIDHEIALMEQQLERAIAVPELHEDRIARERAARFIGACTLDNTVEFTAESVRPIESLFDALQRANRDPEARKLVETNVRTDVVERTIKTGHVIKIAMDVDEAGKIQQFGQSMESVQANSLKFAANSWQMRERTEAETTNAFRIEQLYKNDTLDDYAFVVFSRAADNMSISDMAKTGFFVDTMSTAIQVTTVENGALTTESAFVSGVKTAGEQRHDAETLARVGDEFGVNYHGKSATESLGIPMLVPKSRIKNGVIDIVEIWDNGETFFGEDRPREDYLDYKQKCLERETMLKPKVDAIVRDLIAEAPTIRDRLHATQRLAKLSEYHMLQQAVFDRTIDARVFGSDAIIHIEQARIAFELGDMEAGLASTTQALKVARSSSCPGGIGEEGGNMGKDSNKDLEDCEFVSKKCPMCGTKNVKTKVTKHKISGSCGCTKSK